MITITIDTDNAAFADDECGSEVARILLRLAAAITEHGLDDMAGLSLRDINGNKVGAMEVTVEPGENPDDCATHGHE